MTDSPHAHDTQEHWGEILSGRSRAVYNALVTLRNAIGRGDTLVAEKIAELLPEIVRDNLPDDAKLLNRVEKICS